MRLFYLLFIFITFLFPAQEKLPSIFKGRVVGISDGDSFKILYQGNRLINVRLVHIDAPEKGQNYGQKAKQYASSLCFGKEVEVIWTARDRYQRILGEVFIKEKNINKEMIKAGYAWHFKKHSSDSDYAFLEIMARKNRVGLWQEKLPTPPWEWRKIKKSNPKMRTAFFNINKKSNYLNSESWTLFSS